MDKRDKGNSRFTTAGIPNANRWGWAAAEDRYSQKAVAREISGLTSKENLDRWSERARSNSALAAKSKTKGTKGV